mmetsp:Transcript_2754/g.4019  ORF Transcript_2754/g.4019 Transcript_2754/m.4019 type:complete len:88 (-) Transcript_2754:20-283(-)
MYVVRGLCVLLLLFDKSLFLKFTSIIYTNTKSICCYIHISPKHVQHHGNTQYATFGMQKEMNILFENKLIQYIYIYIANCVSSKKET